MKALVLVLAVLVLAAPALAQQPAPTPAAQPVVLTPAGSRLVYGFSQQWRCAPEEAALRLLFLGAQASVDGEAKKNQGALLEAYKKALDEAEKLQAKAQAAAKKAKERAPEAPPATMGPDLLEKAPQ